MKRNLFVGVVLALLASCSSSTDENRRSPASESESIARKLWKEKHITGLDGVEEMHDGSLIFFFPFYYGAVLSADKNTANAFCSIVERKATDKLESINNAASLSLGHKAAY